MQQKLFLVINIALYFVLLLVLCFFPGTAQWSTSVAFLVLPYVLLGIAVLLGIFFAQSKISLVGLLLAGVTFMVDHPALVNRDPVRQQVLIVLAAMILPLLVTLLYHVPERGLFSLPGGMRALATLPVLGGLFLLTFWAPLQALVVPGGPIWVRPISAWLPFSPLVLVSLAGAVPLLFIRKRGESPQIGVLLGVTLLFVLSALSFKARIWDSSQARTVLVAFMAGAGLTLIWAVLETSWWHANIDELTELPTRRALKHHFTTLGASYAIAMIDIDFFKRINDVYGHGTGDQVLRFIASFLKAISFGKAYRYGGEEFVIVAEGGSFDETTRALEALREAIANRPFGIKRPPRPLRKPKHSPPDRWRQLSATIPVTVSMGVARSAEQHGSPQGVLEAADTALYRAKAEGRNCLRIMPGPARENMRRR